MAFWLSAQRPLGSHGLSKLPPEKRQQLVSLHEEYNAKRRELLQGVAAKAGSMDAAQAQAERTRVTTAMAKLKKDFAGRALNVVGLDKLMTADRSQLRADLKRIKADRDAKLQAVRSEAMTALSKARNSSDTGQTAAMVADFKARAATIRAEARKAATAVLSSAAK